jgi:hypothetical protein
MCTCEEKFTYLSLHKNDRRMSHSLSTRCGDGCGDIGGKLSDGN